MGEVVIRAQGLGKKYRIRHERQEPYTTLREVVTNGVRRVFSFSGKSTDARLASGKGIPDVKFDFLGQEGRPAVEDFWALRDVSFEVRRGEVMGIIGRNGAGKSTLLKILSRITEPAEGRVELEGRVASLLEVGTGFHSELTGRENIFLNGSILGMSRAEVRRKFDEIVAFAEVEAFLDTPVKRYSSGMYVRLAFSVAAHLEPEILIVDEVLAVGDAEFQKKCLGRMGEISGREGRTVLFVSHNMTAVQSLCSRALLLDKGRVVRDGDATQVAAEYLQAAVGAPASAAWPDLRAAPGNDVMRVRCVEIEPDSGAGDGLIRMTSAIRVETEFTVLRPCKALHLTYHLLNQDGITVLTTGSPPQAYEPGSHRAAFRIPGELLNSGQYSLTLLIVENRAQVTYDVESIASFSVVDAEEREGGWMGREPGVVQPRLEWSVRTIDSA